MRELTFHGFLSQYVKSLSFSQSSGIKPLVNEASSKNPRLREPLLLYAVFTGRHKVFAKEVAKTNLAQYYGGLLFRKDADQLIVDLSSAKLPMEYTKVWNSYVSVKNRRQNDDEIKGLMRSKIIKLQQDHHVSNYRIYTDLHLNAGNINAWLKTGDCSKVSIDVARSILQYMKSMHAVVL